MLVADALDLFLHEPFGHLRDDVDDHRTNGLGSEAFDDPADDVFNDGVGDHRLRGGRRMAVAGRQPDGLGTWLAILEREERREGFRDQARTPVQRD